MRALTSKLLVAALLCSSVGVACARGDTRFDRSELDRADAGLILGEYPLAKNAIVDGDTIKIDGLDASMRLIGIDTEETFKSDKAWRAYEQGWEAYLAAEQAKTSRPLKVPTPLGMDAKHWAQEFFRGVTRVRLERDHPGEVRDRFNRYLAYVFVEREGEWVNYNVEAVRAGMSPYFNKYGNSRRFHDEFVKAQAEARAGKRGIWAEGAQCYPDYELRTQWWDGRAEFIAEFEREAQDDPSMIVLVRWDALRKLEDRLGEEVEVLGAIGEVRQGERGPKRVLLTRKMFSDFPLIFWDDSVFEQARIAEYRSEFIRVRGVVSSYTDRRTGERQLQIEVHDPAQVRVPSYVPPGNLDDEDPELDAVEDEDAEAVERPADLFLEPSKPAPSGEGESVDSESVDSESVDSKSESSEPGDSQSPDPESSTIESSTTESSNSEPPAAESTSSVPPSGHS